MKEHSVDGFGQRLSQIRKSRGMTQAELGEAVGVSNRVIAYYEADGAQPPGAMLVDLAKALRVSTDQLLGLKAPKDKRSPRTARSSRDCRRSSSSHPPISASSSSSSTASLEDVPAQTAAAPDRRLNSLAPVASRRQPIPQNDHPFPETTACSPGRPSVPIRFKQVGVASRHVEDPTTATTCRATTPSSLKAGGGDGPLALLLHSLGPRGVRASRPRKCSYAKPRRGGASSSSRLRKGAVREALASVIQARRVRNSFSRLHAAPGPPPGLPRGRPRRPPLVTGPARRVHLLRSKAPVAPGRRPRSLERKKSSSRRAAPRARTKARCEERGHRGTFAGRVLPGAVTPTPRRGRSRRRERPRGTRRWRASSHNQRQLTSPLAVLDRGRPALSAVQKNQSNLLLIPRRRAGLCPSNAV